ncbi:MAG: UDP-N-acetylmuramoyl-tripeptide--D-alanyl-D-alanine ligase [Acidobacteriota bacterium]
MNFTQSLTVHDLKYNGTRPATAAFMDTIMEQMTAAQVRSCIGGILLAGSPSSTFSGISIDSRTLNAGDLFFAIRGPRQDGHRFLAAALDRGAAGAVVDAGFDMPEPSPPGRVLLQVEDTHRALKNLAADVRRRWKGSLVAITGSMGKTTTKEFVAQVLQTEFSVYRSPGNLNNLYGLPLALFGLSPEDHIGVFELGMSAAGEIAEMCRIARPDIGVITNVAPVHLEFFPSLEAIAQAKGELAGGLREDGTLVYNADDPLVRQIAGSFPGRKVGFGFSETADVRAGEIEIAGLEETRWRLSCEGITRSAVIPLGGLHYVMNALPAVALARHYRISLEQVLEALRGLPQSPMRGQVVRFRAGFTLIDDSYNSNPRALELMIDNLAAQQAHRRRILVAGEMLELGPDAPALHYECGARAARAGIDVLVAVQGNAKELASGAIAAGMPAAGSVFFTEVEPATDFVFGELREGDIILVKGSRGVRLDRMVQALRSHYTELGH